MNGQGLRYPLLIGDGETKSTAGHTQILKSADEQ